MRKDCAFGFCTVPLCRFGIPGRPRLPIFGTLLAGAGYGSESRGAIIVNMAKGLNGLLLLFLLDCALRFIFSASCFLRRRDFFFLRCSVSTPQERRPRVVHKSSCEGGNEKTCRRERVHITKYLFSCSSPKYVGASQLCAPPPFALTGPLPFLFRAGIVRSRPRNGRELPTLYVVDRRRCVDGDWAISIVFFVCPGLVDVLFVAIRCGHHNP